jgi:putative phosphoesterase
MPKTGMMLRRLGVIGDVHAEDELLQAALELLPVEGAELMVCTGDVADGPGNVDACCELLAHAQAITVRGNHDRWLLGGRMRDVPGATQLDSLADWTRDYLKALPPTVELQAEGGPLLLCHGIGDNDLGQLKAEDEGYALENNTELQQILRQDHFRYLIAGHTHEAMVRRLNRLTVINPGTLSREHRPTFVLLDLGQGSVQFYHFDERRAVVQGESVSLLDLDGVG